MSRNSGKGVPLRAIAPGSAPRATPSAGLPPRLNPQPKPIGPAKGGPPPFGTKPPRPGSPLSPLIRGEKQGGHGQAFHTKAKDQTLGQRILGTNPDGSKAPPSMKAATKALSKADEKRTARVLSKSPEVQKAMKQMAASPAGTKPIAVTVPVPPGRTAPAIKVVPRLPNGQPGPMSVQKATQVTAVIQKGLPPGHAKHVPGPAKVGFQTMYASTANTAGKPPKK